MRLPSPQELAQFATEMPQVALDRLQAIAAWVQENPQLFLLVASLSLGPALFWLWLFLRKGRMDAVHRRFMVLTFLFGMLAVPIVFLIHMAAQQLLGINISHLFHGVTHETLKRALYFIVVVGMVEEYAKHLIVKEVDYNRRFFNRIADGIEFSVAAALGFAFIENILYFVDAWETLSKGAFAGVVAGRSVASMLAHVLFSGIFGYYYGRAKFLEDMPAKRRMRHRFHIHLATGIRMRWERLKRAFTGNHLLLAAAHRLRRDELIAEGLFIAMVLHGLYDLFLDMNRVYLIVPLLFLEFLFIWHELELTENFTVHQLKERSRWWHRRRRA